MGLSLGTMEATGTPSPATPHAANAALAPALE